MDVDWYTWVKAAHIISVIAWMAALLYLPRLFVYHCEAEPGSQMSETFKVMERRLLKAIMTPAMIAAWLFGLTMLLSGERIVFAEDIWVHVKLLLVLIMSALHGGCAAWARAFAEDRNTRSPRFFRVMNEVPAVLMIAIVILAVTKPF